MNVDFFALSSTRGVRLTRTQAYKMYPQIKDDVQKELRDFKKSNCLTMKLSYEAGLQVWAEKTLDEVKNANKGFQTRTEQVEGPKKTKIIQESRN